MINFFRKIRKKLADDNKFFKYWRYAIGEIVLVVIGILIALSINNWNERQKAQKRTNLLLEKTQKELLYNIERCNLVIDFYRGKDSLYYKVINKKVTSDDYKSNGDYYELLGGWEEAKLVDDAFKNMTENDGNLSLQQDSILLKLKDLYGTKKTSIVKWDDRTSSLILNHWDKLSNEKEWFSEEENPSEIMTEYHLADPFYLNQVYKFGIYGLNNHLGYILEFKREATNIYEDISHHLDLKKDSAIVKNMSDYKHYIGIYEVDSLYNVHVELENNTLIANFIAKNDTIIEGSHRIYPDSKDYFMVDNIFFGRLKYDENEEVVKIIISRLNFQQESIKID